MNVIVTAPGRSLTFRSTPGQRVLYAGLASGVGLPHECISGTCGTCKARLKSGHVEKLWAEAPGWSLIKPSEYLLCQCAAIGDCEFEVGSILEGPRRCAVPEYRRGRIADWRLLSRDVVAFTIKLDGEMAFDAGQFVALGFPGVEGTRCYSMVNSTSPANSLDFVIKRKPGGAVSAWIFEAARNDQEVDCFGPVGQATFDPDAGKDILCVAGGSGIAGMMSIMRRAAEARYFDRFSGHVFFGLRSAADAFFLDELSQLARSAPGSFHVTVALSEEPPSDDLRSRHPALTFEAGMVHEVMGLKMQSPLTNLSAFVAGPPPAVTATLRSMLLQLKLAASSIKYDKFG